MDLSIFMYQDEVKQCSCSLNSYFASLRTSFDVQDYAKAPNLWSLPLPEMYDDIKLFTEPKRLPAASASKMKADQMDKMLAWFRRDDVDL